MHQVDCLRSDVRSAPMSFRVITSFCNGDVKAFPVPLQQTGYSGNNAPKSKIQGDKIARFKNGSSKVAIKLRVVQFWASCSKPDYANPGLAEF